jgi:DNA-binding transcriptional ArsR family regulator
MTENNGDSFTSTKAEVFEALGHPTRIRILQELASKPLAYSELKRAAGMESNGLLTFHLGRLKDLVGLNAEGNYALTDEGREALRIVEASKSEVKRQEVVSQHFSIRTRHPTPVLVFLIVALVALASVSMVEYTQVQALDSNLNNTPPIPSPCTMQVSLGGVETPVLLMQPGTTGYICITYQSEWQGNSGQYQSGLFSNGIFPFGFSILNATLKFVRVQRLSQLNPTNVDNRLHCSRLFCDRPRQLDGVLRLRNVRILRWHADGRWLHRIPGELTRLCSRDHASRVLPARVP